MNEINFVYQRYIIKMQFSAIILFETLGNLYILLRFTAAYSLLKISGITFVIILQRSAKEFESIIVYERYILEMYFSAIVIFLIICDFTKFVYVTKTNCGMFSIGNMERNILVLLQKFFYKRFQKHFTLLSITVSKAIFYFHASVCV